MKNTKFRKKALLSSIAMLLVALVALGSATFAWFSANPLATASGVKVNTTTAAGLLAKADSDTRGFSHDTTLRYAETLTAETDDDSFAIQPVSYDYAGTAEVFSTAEALNEGSYEKSAADFQSASAGYYKEKVFLKSTGAGNTATVQKITVTIEPTALAMAASIRVLLTDKDGAVIGTWATDGVGNKYATGTPKALSATAYDCLNSGVAKTGLDLTATDSETANFVTAYIYLDGEDTACFTTNVTNAADLIDSVSIDFTTEA